MRIKLNFVLVIMTMIISAIFISTFSTTVTAKESGYWKLTDLIEKVDPDREGFTGGTGSSIFGKHSTLSRGEFYQVQTASRECSDCHIIHCNERRVTATIPPESLTPGETIEMHVTVDGKVSDMECHYGCDKINADFSAQFLASDSPVNFVDEAGIGCCTDVENGIAHVEKKLTAVVPEATHYGLKVEKLNLLMNYCSDGSTILIYTWVADDAPPAYSGTEQSEGDDTPVRGDDGLSPPLMGAIVIAFLGGSTVIIIRLVRKKPSPPKPSQNNGPEVYDWRGNRIDENARVQQTHEQYTQANRDAQAEYDAKRQLEEATRIQHESEQDRMLNELIRISQRLSTTTRNAAWKMNDITRKQIDSAISGGELDPATFKRIRDGFRKLAKGKMIGEDDIPPMPTNAQFAAMAYEDAFEEVCRNQTIDAVLVRSGSAFLTGGASEYFYNAGKAVYRMRDYVEAGGDNFICGATEALYGAAEDYVVSKTVDKFLKAGQKCIKGKMAKTPKIQRLKSDINWQLRVATNDGYYCHSLFPNETKLMNSVQRFLQRETAMAQKATKNIAQYQAKQVTKAVIKKPLSPISKAAQSGVQTFTR